MSLRKKSGLHVILVFPTITGSPQTVNKVKKGAAYYYERTPRYDPKTKNTVYKYRSLGKDIDGNVGRVRITLPRRCYFYAPFLPLVKITDSLHMGGILSSITGKKRSAEIIALAMSKIVRPLPMKSISAWIEGIYLPNLLGVNLREPQITLTVSRRRARSADKWYALSPQKFTVGLKGAKALKVTVE